MKIRNLSIISSSALLFICCSLSTVQGAGFTSLNDCLVTNDIGRFSFESQSAWMGDGSGVVAMADHFNKDHLDTVCRGEYSNISEIRGLPINEARKNILGVEVQVTQHTNSDSDKWLLHEMDAGFRDKYGIPAVSFYPWQIANQAVLINAVGGREYRWLSGNKVVVIEYHGSLTQNPEPLEVVKAYLTKHPSTLTAMTLSQLRSAENKTIWIKDEMERRLWLCDKWFGQLQSAKENQKNVLQQQVKSMNVFIDYREKYFGQSAKDEKILLDRYLHQNDSAAIQAKLTEYKTWWSAHKADTISLP